jgi:hypothetical protein
LTERWSGCLLCAIEGRADHDARRRGKAPGNCDSLLRPPFGQWDGRRIVGGVTSVRGAFAVAKARYAKDRRRGRHSNWHVIVGAGRAVVLQRWRVPQFPRCNARRVLHSTGFRITRLAIDLLRSNGEISFPLAVRSRAQGALRVFSDGN